MAANMYRVGGMYVNVDLFIKLKPFQFCIPWDLCGAIFGLFAPNSEIRLCYTYRGALSFRRKVSVSKYFGFKMGQASRLSWPQQLAASLLNG